MSGDVRAVMALLRIHDARMRLLGLYPKQARRDPRASWDNCQGPPTVVVRADDCRHEGCERHGKSAIARTHRRVSDGPSPGCSAPGSGRDPSDVRVHVGARSRCLAAVAGVPKGFVSRVYLQWGTGVAELNLG